MSGPRTLTDSGTPLAEEASIIPVELPQPRTRLVRVLRVFLHAIGRISRGEHDAACEIIFSKLSGRGLEPQMVIQRAGLIYEGLTGLRPVIGCLKCQESGLGVIGIALAFRHRAAFYTARAVDLSAPVKPDPEQPVSRRKGKPS